MSDLINVQYPQFKIHNRTGSAQFTLKPAYFDGKTYETRAGEFQVLIRGHLMVEMANATGKTDDRGYIIYNWAGKVSMKLSDKKFAQLRNRNYWICCILSFVNIRIIL